MQEFDIDDGGLTELHLQWATSTHWGREQDKAFLLGILKYPSLVNALHTPQNITPANEKYFDVTVMLQIWRLVWRQYRSLF